MSRRYYSLSNSYLDFLSSWQEESEGESWNNTGTYHNQTTPANANSTCPRLSRNDIKHDEPFKGKPSMQKQAF